ncbi:ATP-binding protein [Neptuniibacter sp. QD34_54]|uniref:HAMP domain-containing hybrid sensor histidine kinase/response regulator n=1 Tax=unclassified Neptuniibacter TaxID=2630693 RepID=UPI0039F6D15C
MNSFNLLGRLLFIIAGVIALVLGGSTAVFIKEIRSENLNNLKTASESIVAPLIKEVFMLVQSSDNYDWALKVQSINANRLFKDHKQLGVIEIIVLNELDEVVAHNDIARIGLPIEPTISLEDIYQEGVSRTEGVYWIGNQILIANSNKPVGHVIVGFEATELQKRIQNVLKNSALLFCLFFIIGLGLAYYFVTRQITRPIRELVTASNAITSGDYYYPVNKTSSDEIGELASGLEIMQKAIRSKIEDLETYKAHLETEVENRTQEFLAAKLEAEESNRAKSRFLANMSHELRTPLNAVLGFSQILYGKEFSSEKLSYLSSINSAGNTLLGLINEVLDFSKIESGKMEIQYAPFSPRYLLEEIHSMFLQRAAEKDLYLSTHCDENVPAYLLCDAFRLKQILMNLCSNSIKFTSEGRVSIQLSVSRTDVRAQKVGLKLTVTDTGKGIPKEDQESIFSAFEQVKGQKTSEYGGTGLGLAITQKLVNLMQGSIEVISEGEGKGATFKVLIPEIEITDSKPVTDAINIKLNNAYQFSPATILVIDDISYNRDLLISYLSDQPFEFLQAEDGEEGLALLETHKPDLILTDLKMPNMDGHHFLKKVQDLYPENEFTLMLITASVQDSDVIENKDLCHEILSKPISKDMLLASLAKYLDAKVSAPPESDMADVDVNTAYLLLDIDEANSVLEMAELGELSLLEEKVEDIREQSTQHWLQKKLDDLDLDTLIEKLRERINLESDGGTSAFQRLKLDVAQSQRIIDLAEVGDLGGLEGILNSIDDPDTKQWLEHHLDEINLERLITEVTELLKIREV